jgi:hypothetical protein
MKANDQPQQVYDFLKRNANVFYCADCLGKQTNVNRHHVNNIVSTLALFPKEFVRTEGICPHGCNSRDKHITKAL